MRFQDAQSGHKVLNGSGGVLLSVEQERSATGRDMELLIGFWIRVQSYTYILLAIRAEGRYFPTLEGFGS